MWERPTLIVIQLARYERMQIALRRFEQSVAALEKAIPRPDHGDRWNMLPVADWRDASDEWQDGTRPPVLVGAR